MIFTNTSQVAKESSDPVKAAQLPARLELSTLREFVTLYVSDTFLCPILQLPSS